MKGYSSYYRSYSPWAMWRFLWDGAFASGIRRISLANRQKDYAALSFRPDLMALHARLHAVLERSWQEWASYDYGEGYYYQGCPSVGITGLRDTRARVSFMDLQRLLKGRSVCEIGCNTGFLSVESCVDCREWFGFDINPFAVAIGEEVRGFLGRNNCRLEVSSFEALALDRQFDAVLSFANHSTFDKNTHQSIREYFSRCARLLAPEGIFLFESHPPAYEGKGLEEVLKVLAEFFVIEKRAVLDCGSYLDRGRTFVVARKRENP